MKKREPAPTEVPGKKKTEPENPITRINLTREPDEELAVMKRRPEAPREQTKRKPAS